jgi:Tfp pilus assembly protein PilE
MGRTRPSDDGDTLIEILAAVTILSIGVVALITALGVMSTTTVSNRSQAQAETALLAGAEFVKNMPLTTAEFASCGPAGRAINPTEVKIPAGFSLRFAQGSAVASAPCTQLVKIPVQVSGDGYNLSLDVVRRA